MKKTICTLALASLMLTACSQREPSYIGPASLEGKRAPITLGIDRGDFEKAAVSATEDLLRSGALDRKNGGRYVVAIDEIINDTTQRIDTDMLIKKIRIALLKSGKAVVTTAIKVGGPESTLTKGVRELRSDDEVKRTSIAKKDSIIAPDMGLSGKIIQRNARTYNDKQLVEYYFQLSLTHLESGLAIWEDEIVIGKIGSKDSVSW